MRTISTLWLTLLFVGLVSLSTTGQDGPDDRAWSIYSHNPTPVGTVNPVIKIDEFTEIRTYSFGETDVTVLPPNRVLPSSNSTQSELSIDVHPLDENIVFGSSNATNWPVSTLYGTGVYWSMDGSQTYPWGGTDNPATLPGFNSNSGDPASVIGVNGYWYEGYISNASGQGISVSTNNGANWSSYTVAPNPGSLADKNHLMVDKTSTSPYVNRVYASWTDFGGVNDEDVVIRYSTNFGQSWTSSINLSSTLSPGSHAQGTNIQTGPNGEVYVAYAIYDAWPGGEDAIGLSKSTDGGATWTHSRIYSAVNFGIRGNLSSKNGIRVSSFPSMGIDRSGGPYDGAIYICFPQRNVAPAGSDPDIVLISSFDGGTTWTPPIRVNDDPLNNGKDQYYPWLTVDQSSGRVSLVWYDSRDVPNNQAEVFMGHSTDGAATFENFKVSSQPHNPAPIPGLAGGYAGDYIGVAGLNDVAYPFWAENSTGNYQAWTARVEYGPPCPVDPPTNPSPANGALDVPITLANISWDNGAGATQMELWFGEAGSMSMVYTGSLITSWSIPGNLNYFTDYNWRVVGKNDTCSTNGPVWVFKTEQDPNFVVDTTKVYPQNVARWTGTTDGTSITDQSEVRGLDDEDGWFMFDISAINDDATVTEITFYGYVNSTNWPYWSATPLPGLNPLTATASQLKTAIEANSGSSIAYIYENESSSFSTGWHNYPMENGAIPDFEASLNQDWFAMGMDSRDNSTTYYLEWDGWNQPNIPYLEVIYNFIVPVELNSFTATAGEESVELKWNTATETNNRGFEIERKAGNGNFENIGYVAGFGTTTEPKAYAYTDEEVNVGEYTYRLKQIDFDGSYEYSDEVNVVVELPIEYALEQNYPNPFNPSTTIKYSIPEDGFVKLAVYNMLGEEVSTLINTQQKAGRYEVTFDASQLASGVYIYRLEAANFTSSKKLMLMK